MKKLIAFLLTFVMIACLFSGCGGSGTEAKTESGLTLALVRVLSVLLLLVLLHFDDRTA